MNPATVRREQAQGQSWIETCARRLMIGFHMPDYDQLPGYRGLIRRGLAAPLLARFAPRRLVRELQRAHVQAFYCYNKCHRGNCYYPSRVPGAHVHSALRGRDLFGELVDACRKRGIVPLCIYEFMDYRVPQDHPDWCCRRMPDAHAAAAVDGFDHAAAASRRDLRVGAPCLHGPYAEFAIAQAVETVRAYPVQAYYVDFLGRLAFDGWVCPRCNAAFRAEFGFDFTGVRQLSRPDYARYVRWHYRQYTAYADRLLAALRAVRPDLVFVHNAHCLGHVPNLQRWEDAARRSDFLTCDAFAFSEGMLAVDWRARAFAAASRRRPELLLDAVQGGDPWNPKALDSHRAEMWTARMQGLAVSSSLCFRPDGSWNPASLALTRRVFAEQRRFEPWLADAEPVARIGLVHSQPSSDLAPRRPPHGAMALHDAAFEGWAQALIRDHRLWSVVHEFQLEPDRLRRYRALIVPEAACLNDAACAALDGFVRGGGRLLVTGESGRRREDGRERRIPGLARLTGARVGARRDPRLREARLLAPEWRERMPWVSADVRFEAGLAPVARLAGGAAVLARALGSFSGRLLPMPVVWRRRVGRGAVLVCAGEPGAQQRLRGGESNRRLVRRMLDWLDAGPAPVRVTAPPTVEVCLLRQRAAARWLVGLIQSLPGVSRPQTLVRTIHSPPGIDGGPYHPLEEVAEMPAVARLEVRLRPPSGCRIRRVYRAPDRRPLPTTRRGAECRVEVREAGVFTMLVAEFERRQGGRA